MRRNLRESRPILLRNFGAPNDDKQIATRHTKFKHMMTKFCCAHISKIMKIKICTISDFWAFEITKIVIENIKILSKITKFVHLVPLDEFRASQQKI